MKTSVQTLVFSRMFKSFRLFVSTVTPSYIWRAYMIKELVMVRDGVCCLSSGEFFRNYVLALIFNLSVS